MPSVHILHLSPDTLAALADGDLVRASATSPVPLAPWFSSDGPRAVWRMRAQQTAADPSAAAWVTGAIWDPVAEVAVGRAGFHAPPDDGGMVEIGYETDPAYRRRGYARAAFEALLARAAAEPDVRTVRVTIAPDNTASSNLVASYGFVAVGEQIDPEDGLEIIYEVDADRFDSRTHPT